MQGKTLKGEAAYEAAHEPQRIAQAWEDFKVQMYGPDGVYWDNLVGGLGGFAVSLL